jgi:NADPH-dependent 2,4-dienoyl-CoA reductase/sulfur reductase-like enzyme
MEAAWVAAARGHTVTLCEASDELGGQGLLAAVPPGREEWSEMVRYLSRQVVNEGVDVMLGTTFTPDLLDEFEPDILVIATGARQIVPAIAGIDGPTVINAWDVLTGVSETGDTVAVVGGGAVGIETATFLAEQGKEVTVIEMMDKCGADMGLSSRWVILKDAAAAGVKTVQSCRVVKITREGAYVEAGSELRLFPADSVVIAVGSKAENGLWKSLSEKGLLESLEFYKVGDCVEPRKVYDAIHEGFEVGLRI